MEDEAFRIVVGGQVDAPEYEPSKGQQVAIISIAISLKRIADALRYDPAGNRNIWDLVNDVAMNTRPDQ